MSVFASIDPAEWVASNDLAFAIRDAYPVSRGHTLVVPRRVVGDWWGATTDEQHAIIDLVGRVRRRLDAELSPDGYNVGFNAGAAAGQTVGHLHVHVIPRYAGDTADPRGGVRHVIPGRGNYLIGDDALTGPGAFPPPELVTPFDGRLTLELVRCLIRDDLDRIDLLISFVKRSGVGIIARHLDDALQRGAHIRLLTTDYLAITDADALGFFLDRLTDGPTGRLEARVFSDPTTSFHPKAYIFTSSQSGEGVAFVGSSNLTRSGLVSGIEWNLHMSRFVTRPLVEEFDRLWSDGRSLPLTADWLGTYDLRQREQHPVTSPSAASFPVDGTGDEPGVSHEQPTEPLRPWSVQAEALAALEATRIEGHGSGLVVMATGLGKTWLAAFDSTRPSFRKVLFVAHREEILTQARDVFRRIRPGGRLSLFVGGERDRAGEVVFASVQSLRTSLTAFDPDEFDYIVVDEFHHAAAPTYRKVLAHFRPRFLLGLTATPSRADNADLLALCSDNLVYECGLVTGVQRELLSPFRYRAIPDVADYEHIPWKNGRFDLEALTTHVATHERARQVFDEWSASGGNDRRTLAFCCTIVHADFMAEFFRERGVAAVAVHSGPSSAPRAESLERLAGGSVPVVFTVDLFNEGVDVPTIDLVMMLRPTESAVVFLQQLGRGLRRAEGKAHLDVVDLVGNHRGFLLKARVLAALMGRPGLTDREAVELLREQAAALADGTLLPDGCSIVVAPEVVDLLGELLGPVSPKDRLIELIREWTDEHGRRPTALEVAVLAGSSLPTTKSSGWFTLLDDLGLLTEAERAVVGTSNDFLRWIEHGSYTKSYKLVTLLAMLRTGTLRTGAAVRDLATTARWMITNDTELLTDLADAGSAFADLTAPTPDEWLRYWQRNPIAALTNATRGQDPWFDEDDGVLRLRRPVADELAEAFDAMTGEIVEYRLHRYLAGRSARRVGEQRKPVVDGVEIDATFSVETTGVVATSVVIESSGGTKGSPNARNLDYVAGFDVVLSRLATLGVHLVDAYVDTTSTTALTIADRRLATGQHRYPIDLAGVDDLAPLRKSLLSSMAKVGRQSGAEGGGNQLERTRLVIATPTPWTAAQLADLLASGAVPPASNRTDPVATRRSGA